MIDTGSQMIFSGIEFGFRWVADWYEYDGEAAEDKAKAARNDKVKELRAAGRTVKCFSLGRQLRSMGGIGSGHPHIEVVTRTYGINYL